MGEMGLKQESVVSALRKLVSRDSLRASIPNPGPDDDGRDEPWM